MNSTLADAKRFLGELFIMGFEGKVLSDETAAFISKNGIGGTILFAHNYENPIQVAELTLQIQEARRDLPLWVSVDHEGGRVQRFKDSFTIIPEAARIAATDSPKLAFEIAEGMARELKAVGINLNFCPDADINTNPDNPVIGKRAFGDNEESVSKMVTAFVRGHLTQGVQPCVKHFPGHGDTKVDSHFELPTITTPFEVIKEREIKPFIKAFKSRCAFVMTAHIMIPHVDPKFPATLSHKIVTEFLREELRYNRIIVTDDMEMQAITSHFGAEEAPRLAIEAGCDMLIYRSEKATRIAYKALLQALEDGRLNADRVMESVNRIRTLKKEVLEPYTAPYFADILKIVGQPELGVLVRSVP